MKEWAKKWSESKGIKPIIREFDPPRLPDLSDEDFEYPEDEYPEDEDLEPEIEEDTYDNWTKTELLNYAASLTIEVRASWTKAEIIEAIEAAE